MGRPALVKTDDGTLAYGVWCGYTYCGAAGLNTMTGNGNIQVTRRAATWYDKTKAKDGLS